jgi:NADH:ubiquinone oxidoreductase subunit 4 (subunit M)
LPLLACFISEFLALRGAFEANPYWAAWAALGIILNAGLHAVALPANVLSATSTIRRTKSLPI